MLKLPKRFHPDFSRPGVKATGAIEVDWDSPLSDKLFFAHVPQSINRTQDLVSGRQADTVSTLTRMNGQWYQQNELSTLAPTIWDIEWPYAALGGSDDSEYTMMWRIRIPDADGSSAASIFKWGSSEIEIKRFLDTVTLQWAGAVRLTVSSVSDGDVIDIAFNRDASSNDVDQYVNGELISTVGGIGNTTFNGCDTIRYHEEADQRGEGIALFYCWVDRKLSAAQIKSLHNDPYQIIKPVNDPYYFTASGAPAGETLEADPGVYSLGSDPVNLLRTHIFDAGLANYTLGSDAANLLHGRVSNLDVATYSLGGDSVDFTVSSFPVMSADVGVYSLGSDPITFLINRVINLDVGSYTLSGDDVTFIHTEGDTLNADVGVYTLGSDTVTFSRDYTLAASTASYNLTFTDANFVVSAFGTPDCFTYLNSKITESEFLTGALDVEATFLTGAIDPDGQGVIGLINDDNLFLSGVICS